VAVVVVHQGQLCVVVFTTPLNRLDEIPGHGDSAVGGVGVGGTDVAVLAVDLTDVFGEIPSIGEPGAVYLNSQRTRGGGLRGVPGQQPQCRLCRASQVAAGNLEVAAINIALVERNAAVDRHLLGSPAAHVVVGAFHSSAAIRIAEQRGTILRIVSNGPDARACLHERLIARIVEGRYEVPDGGVLIQTVCCIGSYSLSGFLSSLAIADVIVIVGIALAGDRGSGQLAAVVVGEGIAHALSIARCAAGGGAAKRIVGIGTACHLRIAALVEHAGEQVSLILITKRKRHVIITSPESATVFFTIPRDEFMSTF